MPPSLLFHFTARRAASGVAITASLFFAACGGGGGSASSDTSAQTTAQAAPSAPTASTPADTTPVPPPTTTPAVVEAPLVREILQNSHFDDGVQGWSYSYVTVVASELRAGAKALSIGWQVSQTVPAAELEPGKSYTLIVKARRDKADSNASITMRFRKPRYSETFRTYKVAVTSDTWQDYRIDFTAPAYTGMADVILTAESGGLRVDSASLKGALALPQTEPVAFSAGSYVPAGYTLAFNDEFNGTTLNRKKWFTRYIYGGETSDHLNDEKQHYRDNDNHQVAGGVLSLVARKVSSAAEYGMNYESGMIRSDWTTRYGYFEARVKMPGGIGMWPAFWLNADVDEEGRLGWPPEIDIFEFVNNGVEDRVNMVHQSVIRQTSTTAADLLYADTNFHANNNDYYAGFNFNEGWHTIGCEWEPDRVTFYVDGVKTATRAYTWTYADGGLAGPAHILLNLAVGGSWAGRHGIDDSAFPQALQIDWVRAYKKD